MTKVEPDTALSRKHHDRALRFLPKGVTGDSRFWPPYPLVFRRAEGKWLEDVDGNRYLDYHSGFGTAILGYAHPEVDEAVIRAIREVGAYVGVPNPYEAALAERLCGFLPGADRVALCGGGGTDAIYHCLRVARAATGRTRVVKIEGGYQGWHGDTGASTRPGLAQAGDSHHPTPVPNSAGTLPAVLDEIVVAPVNDPGALDEIFAAQGDQIAALLIEPVLYSAGCVRVDQTYLDLVRRLCSKHGAVLVFDEVLTGFRNGVAGAGARAGVVPDLSAFGKAIANGYVLSFLGGRAEFMTLLAPEGPVFYSGTFNGHPVSVAAAMATLDVLERDDVPAHLWRLADEMADAINAVCAELDVNATCQAYGGVLALYFGTQTVNDYRDWLNAQTPEIEYLGLELLRFLRARGIYVQPRYVPRWFVTAQHDEADVDRTVGLIRDFVETHRSDLAL